MKNCISFKSHRLNVTQVTGLLNVSYPFQSISHILCSYAFFVAPNHTHAQTMRSFRYEGYKFLKNLYDLFAPAIYILKQEIRICSPVSYSRCVYSCLTVNVFFSLSFHTHTECVFFFYCYYIRVCILLRGKRNRVRCVSKEY